MALSIIRSYLPDYINNNMMFYVGKTICTLQYYINTTFSASEMTDRIYVGDLASASNKKALKGQGITHILSVINGSYELFPNDFTYNIIHINDDPWVNIGLYFDESIKFIENALNMNNTKIMIHCQRGISRSVTILLAYLIYTQNKTNRINECDIDNTIQKIMKDIRYHRPIADPNDGFIDAIHTYIMRINKY